VRVQRLCGTASAHGTAGSRGLWGARDYGGVRAAVVRNCECARGCGSARDLGMPGTFERLRTAGVRVLRAGSTKGVRG
jgi:hypothetical protein